MPWVIDRPSFYVQPGSAWDNPYGIPPAELEKMERELPAEVVAQTIYGMFVEMSGVVFSAEIANELFTHDRDRIMGDVYLDEAAAVQSFIERDQYVDPNRYAHGIDTARKKDYTVITVLDTLYYPARCVYWKRINRVPWPRIYAEIGRAQHLFPGQQLIDGTGQAGDVIVNELQSRLYCPNHHVVFDVASPTCINKEGDQSCVERWIRLNPHPYAFSGSTKLQLLTHLQQCMGHGYDPHDPTKRFGAIRMPPIDAVMNEIQEYQWDDKKLDTDCVMSLALAAWQGIHLQVASPDFGSTWGR